MSSKMECAPFSVASLGGSLPSIYVGTLEKRPGGKALGLFEKALNPSNTSVFAIPTRRPSYTKGHIDEDSMDDCSNSSVKHVGGDVDVGHIESDAEDTDSIVEGCPAGSSTFNGRERRIKADIRGFELRVAGMEKGAHQSWESVGDLIQEITKYQNTIAREPAAVHLNNLLAKLDTIYERYTRKAFTALAGYRRHAEALKGLVITDRGMVTTNADARARRESLFANPNDNEITQLRAELEGLLRGLIDSRQDLSLYENGTISVKSLHFLDAEVKSKYLEINRELTCVETSFLEERMNCVLMEIMSSLHVSSTQKVPSMEEITRRLNPLLNECRKFPELNAKLTGYMVSISELFYLKNTNKKDEHKMLYREISAKLSGNYIVAEKNIAEHMEVSGRLSTPVQDSLRTLSRNSSRSSLNSPNPSGKGQGPSPIPLMTSSVKRSPNVKKSPDWEVK